LDPAAAPGDRPRLLSEHLEELRRRLLWSLAAVALAAVAGYQLTDPFLHHITRVVGPLVFIRPAEAFLVKIKLALVLGVFISMPVLLYHVWRFIGVAMTVGERRLILGALPFSYLLFAAGAALSWFYIVPAGLRFLLTFGSSELTPFLSADASLKFALWTTLGLGLLFQIPVVIGALARWGMVTAARLRHYRRHAVLGIFIVAALLTPGPDVVSQLLLALPTYLLFEVSVWLARVLEPAKT